jgi:hypothetical protein
MAGIVQYVASACDPNIFLLPHFTEVSAQLRKSFKLHKHTDKTNSKGLEISTPSHLPGCSLHAILVSDIIQANPPPETNLRLKCILRLSPPRQRPRASGFMLHETMILAGTSRFAGLRRRRSVGSRQVRVVHELVFGAGLLLLETEEVSETGTRVFRLKPAARIGQMLVSRSIRNLGI